MFKLMYGNGNLPVSEELLEGSESRVLLISIRRTRSLNSFDLETLTGLRQAVERGSQLEEVRVLMFTGGYGSFSAGADIDYLARLRERGDFRTLRKLLEILRDLLLLIHRVPQFTLASIDGIAADGGLNLALSCDWRITSTRSLYSYPYLELGLCPDVGSSWLLHSLIGLNRTQGLLTSGKPLTAEEAAGYGLVHEIYDPYRQPEKPRELARRLAGLPPLVLRTIKRSVVSNLNPPGKLLDQDIENRMRCLMSDDFGEGIRAFLENRPPRFRNV